METHQPCVNYYCYNNNNYFSKVEMLINTIVGVKEHNRKRYLFIASRILQNEMKAFISLHVFVLEM